jgi:hypothetical protein
MYVFVNIKYKDYAELIIKIQACGYNVKILRSDDESLLDDALSKLSLISAKNL